MIVMRSSYSTHIGINKPPNKPNIPNNPNNTAEDRQTMEAGEDGALVDGLNVILLLLGGTADGGESSFVESILGGDDIVGFALVGLGLGTLYSDGVLFCKHEAPNIVE